mmetsp:Transcript_136949/g.238040  ORF Transcript_136949/g.238040 Transcript_136949/m.238040 type:complete len:324 (-) Transcript_136949:583-1554(-)
MSGGALGYEEKLKEALGLYEQDKTIQAFDIINQLEDAISKEEDATVKTEWTTHLSQNLAVQSLKGEAQRVQDLRQTLSSDEKWNVTSTHFGVRTLFREDEETAPFHLIRVEGHVEAPLLDLLAILCEIDLWPTWLIPQTWVCGLREARTLAHIRPTHLLCYLAATMPWPITHRDICLNVKAVDCMDPHETYKRQIAVLLEGCDSYPGVDIPPEGPYVRACFKPGGILLTPEAPAWDGAPPRTFVQVVICADAKLAYTPAWVMNLFMKNLVFLFLPALRKQVLEVPKAGSPYGERIARQPELYGYLRRRMEECFPEGLSQEVYC